MLTPVPPDLAAWFWHYPDCNDVDALSIKVGTIGDPIATCGGCGRRVAVREETRQRVGLKWPPGAQEAPPRYWLNCVRCDRDMPCTTNRPRIPLCRSCINTPPTPKEATY